MRWTGSGSEKEIVMDIQLNEDCAVFQHDGQVAGEYVLNDRFKPYLKSLYTPRGYNTTIVSPGDHRHHKGLMYGLRCADVNYWEEDPGSGGCGIQEVIKTEASEDGVVQELLWCEESGSLETYREHRYISCCYDTEDDGYHWTWKSRRESLRPHRLIKSEWSLEIPDGRKINYHGLGVRLPWIWAFPIGNFNGVEVEGQKTSVMSACGLKVPEITYWGKIDGQWEKRYAALTLRQSQDFTWFAIKQGFAYLGVGPSNEEEVDVKEGEVFEESYEVIVADRDAPAFEWNEED